MKKWIMASRVIATVSPLWRPGRRVIAAATLSGCALAFGDDPPSWPDTFETRLEALALIQTLNVEILSGHSATLTLERWCRDHHLAEAPTITAKVSRNINRSPTAEQRKRLQVTDRETVMYRRVELQCGDRILSEADNWYVPSRLTPEMNRLLETTETPFGKVVQSLEPHRETLANRLLWSPLPDGWERQSTKLPVPAGHSLAIPDAVFEHRAILYTREHVPFSEVNEIYQRQVLAFPPRLRR